MLEKVLHKHKKQFGDVSVVQKKSWEIVFKLFMITWFPRALTIVVRAATLASRVVNLVP